MAEYVGIRAFPLVRKQGIDFRVDQAEPFPPLLNLREEFGAVAAHFFGSLPRIEHLFEQAEHVVHGELSRAPVHQLHSASIL